MGLSFRLWQTEYAKQGIAQTGDGDEYDPTL